MVRLRFSTAPVIFVPRYGYIRTSKFGVGLSGRQSNFTLFASKTGGSDYVRMGLFASIFGNNSNNNTQMEKACSQKIWKMIIRKLAKKPINSDPIDKDDRGKTTRTYQGKVKWWKKHLESVLWELLKITYLITYVLTKISWTNWTAWLRVWQGLHMAQLGYEDDFIMINWVKKIFSRIPTHFSIEITGISVRHWFGGP